MIIRYPLHEKRPLEWKGNHHESIKINSSSEQTFKLDHLENKGNLVMVDKSFKPNSTKPIS